MYFTLSKVVRLRLEILVKLSSSRPSSLQAMTSYPSSVQAIYWNALTTTLYLLTPPNICDDLSVKHRRQGTERFALHYDNRQPQRSLR